MAIFRGLQGPHQCLFFASQHPMSIGSLCPGTVETKVSWTPEERPAAHSPLCDSHKHHKHHKQFLFASRLAPRNPCARASQASGRLGSGPRMSTLALATCWGSRGVMTFRPARILDCSSRLLPNSYLALFILHSTAGHDAYRLATNFWNASDCVIPGFRPALVPPSGDPDEELQKVFRELSQPRFWS